MKFYRLIETVDKKIIGKYPPFETGYFPVPANHPKFIQNIYYKKVEENEVFVPVPKLRKGSKMVDFMPGYSGREIMSEKLRGLIISAGPIGMQFIPQPIIVDNVEIKGYWLTNNYEFNFDVINFNLTEISIMKTTWDVDFQVKVKNQTEFLSLVDEIKLPQSIKIFRPYFIENYDKDFFALRYVYNGFSFFCSERFRQKLEEEKITGIRFLDLDEVL